jgi:predicted DNA-binding transcriptional regulator AlpA
LNSQNNEPVVGDRLLDIGQVATLLGYEVEHASDDEAQRERRRKRLAACRAFVDRREKAGEFPARIHLGPHARRWSQVEVLAYIKALPRGPQVKEKQQQ